MQARLGLPDYQRLPERTVDLPHAALEFVEGSRVSFQALLSRPVVEAGARVTYREPADSPRPDFLPGQPAGEGFVTESARIWGEGEAVFTWRDQHGLTSSVPWHLNFRTRGDEVPEVSFPEQPAVVAM
jgi:hypothetical protein